MFLLGENHSANSGVGKEAGRKQGDVGGGKGRSRREGRGGDSPSDGSPSHKKVLSNPPRQPAILPSESGMVVCHRKKEQRNQVGERRR